MSSIYQRKGFWYIQLKISGKLVQKSLKTKDKRAAEQLQENLDAQQTLNLLDLSPKKIRIDEGLAQRIKVKKATIKESTAIRYREIAKNLVGFFDNRTKRFLDDLKDNDLAEYIEFRKQQNASGKTIFEELALLRATIQMFINRKSLTASPITEWPKVNRVAKRPETLGCYSLPEIKGIFHYFEGKPVYDYLITHFYTGCRRSELWALTVADINLSDRRIRIPSLKTATNPTNQFRYIEIHTELVPILENRCRGKKHTDLVFPRIGGENWLTKWLKIACKELQIPYRRLHGFRHSFISYLLNIGVHLRKVMAMAGHTNFGTTLKYSHVSQDELRGEIDKLQLPASVAKKTHKVPVVSAKRTPKNSREDLTELAGFTKIAPSKPLPVRIEKRVPNKGSKFKKR